MDDRRFDSVTRTFAQNRSRRTLLKGLLGIGGVTATTAVMRLHDAGAARRGYSGPSFPVKPTPTPPISDCDGLECSGQCCDQTDTSCCGGYCCAGACHGTECCGLNNVYCDPFGCCDGVCMDNGYTCCAADAVCNGKCCGDDARCCQKDDGSHVCTPTGRCCSNADCGGGYCDSEGFCH